MPRRMRFCGFRPQTSSWGLVGNTDISVYNIGIIYRNYILSFLNKNQQDLGVGGVGFKGGVLVS